MALFILLIALIKARPRFKTPEDVPRLVDLITPKDEAYRSAFYFAMRDTLVASDMNQATRVAFGSQRFRVVTLDGKVIDVSGTMAGGGSSTAKGGMSSTFKATDSVSDEELRRLERERDAASDAYNKHKSKLEAARAVFSKEEAKLKALLVEIRKAEMEVSSNEATLASLEKQAKDVQCVFFLILRRSAFANTT